MILRRCSAPLVCHTKGAITLLGKHAHAAVPAKLTKVSERSLGRSPSDPLYDDGALRRELYRRLQEINFNLQRHRIRRPLEIITRSTVKPEQRNMWFDRCIRLLLAYRANLEAVRLFQKIGSAGYRPPESTVRELVHAAAEIVYRLPNEASLLMAREAMGLIERESEKGTMDRMPHSFLRLISPFQKPETINLFLKRLAKQRGLKWWEIPASLFALVIRSFGFEGKWQAAGHWFGQYRARKLDAPAGQQPGLDPQPYFAMMSAGAQNRPMDYRFIQSVLRLMLRDNVAPTLPIFNVIMAAAARTHQPTQVYDLYTVMRQRAAHLIPDAFTFGTLFRTIDRYDRLRSPLVPDARQLFRQLIDAHMFLTRGKPERASATLTTSVLNVALRHFMRRAEYGPALVILRCFSVCVLAPNVRTQHIINVFVLRRINSELHGRNPFPVGSDPYEPTWAERFTSTLLHDRPPSAEMDVKSRLRGLAHARSVVERQLGARALAKLKGSNPPPWHKYTVGDVPQSWAEAAETWQAIDAINDLDQAMHTVQNCALAESRIVSQVGQGEREVFIRRLLMAERAMFPRKPGGRNRKHPFGKIFNSRAETEAEQQDLDSDSDMVSDFSKENKAKVMYV